MTSEEVLRVVLEKLHEHRIPYMVTGSFAGNYYGVPRATQDADVVIDPNEGSLTEFISDIQGQFYADLAAAIDELKRRHMFNIVHLDTGFKVDFIVRKQRPFSEEEFERRRQRDFLGKPYFLASPEDTILAKLEWSHEAESGRQFQDAVGIAKVQQDSLDWFYLRKWAEDLNISSLLETLSEEIKGKN